MSRILNSHAKFLAGFCATAITVFAQSVSIEMIYHSTQTSLSTIGPNGSIPYSFEVHLNTGTSGPDMSNWGPNFTGPGVSSTSIPASGSNYSFQANYATAPAMGNVYATSGGYSLSFTGSSKPTSSSFSSGLSFDSSVTFPTSVPQVTGANNGASGSNGGLNISTTGTTTLTINSFSQYASPNNTYGAEIQAGLKDSSGSIVASWNSRNVLTYTDAELTSLAITGSTLTAGQTYTLSIQYGLFASTPATSVLIGSNTFNSSVAEYFNHTDITITAVPEPSAAAAFLGTMAFAGSMVWRRQRNRGAQSQRHLV